MEFEDEYSWLGRYVLRLRPILRYVMDPRADSRLRELVVEAEERLEQLDELSWRTKAPITENASNGEREVIAEKDPEKNPNSWDPEKVHEFRRQKAEISRRATLLNQFGFSGGVPGFLACRRFRISKPTADDAVVDGDDFPIPTTFAAWHNSKFKISFDVIVHDFAPGSLR